MQKKVKLQSQNKPRLEQLQSRLKAHNQLNNTLGNVNRSITPPNNQGQKVGNKENPKYITLKQQQQLVDKQDELWKQTQPYFQMLSKAQQNQRQIENKGNLQGVFQQQALVGGNKENENRNLNQLKSRTPSPIRNQENQKILANYNFPLSRTLKEKKSISNQNLHQKNSIQNQSQEQSLVQNASAYNSLNYASRQSNSNLLNIISNGSGIFNNTLNLNNPNHINGFNSLNNTSNFNAYNGNQKLVETIIDNILNKDESIEIKEENKNLLNNLKRLSLELQSSKNQYSQIESENNFLREEVVRLKEQLLMQQQEFENQSEQFLEIKDRFIQQENNTKILEVNFQEYQSRIIAIIFDIFEVLLYSKSFETQLKNIQEMDEFQRLSTHFIQISSLKFKDLMEKINPFVIDLSLENALMQLGQKLKDEIRDILENIMHPQSAQQTERETFSPHKICSLISPQDKIIQMNIDPLSTQQKKIIGIQNNQNDQIQIQRENMMDQLSQNNNNKIQFNYNNNFNQLSKSYQPANNNNGNNGNVSYSQKSQSVSNSMEQNFFSQFEIKNVLNTEEAPSELSPVQQESSQKQFYKSVRKDQDKSDIMDQSQQTIIYHHSKNVSELSIGLFCQNNNNHSKTSSLNTNLNNLNNTLKNEENSKMLTLNTQQPILTKKDLETGKLSPCFNSSGIFQQLQSHNNNNKIQNQEKDEKINQNQSKNNGSNQKIIPSSIIEEQQYFSLNDKNQNQQEQTQNQEEEQQSQIKIRRNMDKDELSDQSQSEDSENNQNQQQQIQQHGFQKHSNQNQQAYKQIQEINNYYNQSQIQNESDYQNQINENQEDDYNDSPQSQNGEINFQQYQQQASESQYQYENQNKINQIQQENQKLQQQRFIVKDSSKNDSKKQQFIQKNQNPTQNNQNNYNNYQQNEELQRRVKTEYDDDQEDNDFEQNKNNSKYNNNFYVNQYGHEPPQTSKGREKNDPSSPKLSDEYVIACFDFEAQKNNDLNFKKGDKIQVLNRTKNGWWIGLVKNKIGYFPSNYVEFPQKNQK